ncbi:MAG: MazG family protein [Oscillospiraceae bacterium]|nr:MazG family protein [Oscillospiraceae bacterium]
MVQKEKYDFGDLKKIMHILRSPGGCPWDREQTHASIKNNFIEETYEAVEAIDDNDPKLLKEELGDVLLQIVFHAQISEEKGEFDMDGVCDEICRKLIIRHPHIFADAIIETGEQVLSNWENIKIEEKGYADAREYIKSTAKSLPALMRAQKIHKRLIKRKLAKDSDLAELTDQVKKDAGEFDNFNICLKTIGRILYDIASLAEKCGVDSEQALREYGNEIIKKM